MSLYDEIEKSIKEEPENCYTDKYYFRIEKLGMDIWIANGWIHCAPNGPRWPSCALSLIERWKLWRLYKKWLKDVSHDHYYR